MENKKQLSGIMSGNFDFVQLLKLRLVIVRFGEMDQARWWNTNGALGRKGAQLFSRGFSKTHRFAQARVVFEVARQRCVERFPGEPGCATLWNMPARIEDEFDSHWAAWVDEASTWEGFFKSLEKGGDDLLSMLRDRELLNSEHEAQVGRLRRSAEGRSVPISGIHQLNNQTIPLLAAAFSRGMPGELAIPFVRLEA
jgi:hypothetical protein